MRLQFLIVWYAFCCLDTCFAQENVKIEVEKRIKQEDTPRNILQALEPLLATASQLKYYQETDSINTFYEVKLKYKEKRLSIKFTKEGDFYDLEETIELESLPTVTKDSINAYFNRAFNKYKIKKIQLRYISPSPQFLAYYMKNDLSSFETNYEIEAFIKLEKDSKSGLYEFQFSNQGVLLEKSKVQSREADYVLY